MNPRKHLDEIHKLRVAGKTDAVVKRANRLWAEYEAQADLTPRLGLAAACQMTFIALMDAGRRSEAQRWRARATSTAALSGELNALSMLMLPIAFQTIDLPDPPKKKKKRSVPTETSFDVAVDVVAEINRLRSVLLDRGWGVPGLSADGVARAYHEKTGYLCWRAGHYEEALEHYRAARPHVRRDPRGKLRLDGGERLAKLGLEQDATGTFDRAASLAKFRKLHERAVSGGAMDVAHVFATNIERLERGVDDVQDLFPVEVEDRNPEDGVPPA